MYFMLETIIRIISEQLAIDEENINANSALTDDFGADSLDMVEILMAIETETGVNIPDEVAVDLKTVGDLVAVVEVNNN